MTEQQSTEQPAKDRPMVLIGMFDSPFEHRDWSVGKNFKRIREFNPLVRVPTLILPDGGTRATRCAAHPGDGDGRGGGWLVGDAITQADITVACVVTFLREALGVDPAGDLYPSLGGLNRRCEALPAFQTIQAAFSPP